MDKNPLVSVIVNYWESINYLEQCIDSIQSQVYQNWEIIFIDNNSNKSPKKILNRIKNSKLKYYKLKEYNPLGKARNIALNKCSGDFIAFIDTDDIWHKNKLLLQIKQFQRDKNLGIVICESNTIINNKIIKKKKSFSENDKSHLENLIYSNFIVMSSALIKKEVISKHNIKFQDDFEVLEDTLFFFQIISKSGLFHFKEVLCYWRFTKNSHTFINTKKLFEEKLFFKKMYLESNEYKKQISTNAILNYDINLKILEATSNLYNDNSYISRKILKPYIKKSCKLIFIYILTFFPKKLSFFIYEYIFKRPLI